MIYFVFKYHRKRTAVATSAVHENLPLEITWTVLPVFLVIFMFFVGYKGFKMMRDVPEGAEAVRVIAQQWSWIFVYEKEDITSDRLYLPVGRPVKLLLESRDVIHSFYLPAFRVKEDTVPGRENYIWLDPKKTGTYNIFCAEYCGKDHARMYTTLHVLSEADYQAWIDQAIADKNRPIVIAEAMGPASEEIQRRSGPELYKTYCIACHGPEGQGGLVKNARDFSDLGGWKRSPKITDIFRTLTEGIEGSQMRSFKHLSAWDRFALAHHVAAFYKGSDRPRSTPEDIDQLVEDYDLEKPQAPQERISIEQAMEAVAREAGH
jgi:cytochrome c oxidase subunit II